MFIGERIIYLELHKTACSHVLKLLQAIPTISGTTIGKHNSLSSVPAHLLGDLSSKLKLGNIRNPWDWYVSLWAFGCQGKGGLHGQLTRTPHLGRIVRRLVLTRRFAANHATEWRRVYDDADSPESFRGWLRMLFDPDYRHDVGEGYGESPISAFAGLLTHRYLNLFTPRYAHDKRDLRTFEDLARYADTATILDQVIRTEHLADDFRTSMRRLGISNQEVEQALGSVPEKTNTSWHRRYQDYYDRETLALVGERERYLIHRFNYTFGSA